MIESVCTSVPPSVAANGAHRIAPPSKKAGAAWVNRKKETAPQYTRWAQVGGYFDGDGTVYLRVHAWSLMFSLHWVENWKPQLIQLRRFLVSKGIRSLLFPRVGAWLLIVERRDDVLKAANCMIPFCSKKRVELVTAVRYIQDKITASEAVEAFNAEVRSGQRIGRLRELDLPFTRTGSLALRNSHTASILSSLTENQEDEIRSIRAQSELSMKQIRKKFGVSRFVIGRVLRRR